jgi:UDP-N-acetylmuramate dehydrogenase
MDDGAPLLVEDVPLAPLTTLGVGGAARYLARCRDQDELCGALVGARQRDLKTFVLGGGSNLLVADRGFDGLVVTVDDKSLVVDNEEDGFTRVHAGAGLVWDDLVASMVERGLSGVECLSGIPGLVGAAPIQNIGAYGQEVAEVISSVDAIERATQRIRRFDADGAGGGRGPTPTGRRRRDAGLCVGGGGSSQAFCRLAHRALRLRTRRRPDETQ